jgi:hypothetical protein
LGAAHEKMMSRRFVSAAAILALSLFAVRSSSAQAPTELANLAVEIALPDGRHTFAADNGRDLGDYSGPGFIQRNIAVRDPKIPFTVFFRPDRDSARVEIVFEWGDPFNSNPRHLPAYVARIEEGGKALATIEVPMHYWLSRWRWQSVSRPLIRSPQDLLAAKLVPPFAPIATRPSVAAAKPYAIMGTSSITTYMPTTGERDDIGLMPEAYAEYLATGDSEALQSVLAWAEASGTFPWHLRDPATGAPISYDKYPDATTYDDQSKSGGPVLHMLVAPGITIDASHAPQLTYLPFLLTGDPYYLEELEFAVTYSLGDYPGHGGIIRHDQTREYAWTLRSLLYLIKALPDRVPASLLPKSYWQDKLARNLAWIMSNYVNNPSPKTAVLRSGVDAERIPFWQEDYLATVLGVGVWMGFEEWRPVFAWKIGSTIARSNGTSGWPRTSPTLYYAKFRRPDGSEVTSWSDLAALNDIPASSYDEIDPKVDANYASFARGALAIAVRLGFPEASAPLKWLDGQVRSNYLPWRWALQ